MRSFDDLTPEQKEKAKACTSPEELLSLATQEGLELSDEELSAVSGGDFWDGECNHTCPSACCQGSVAAVAKNTIGPDPRPTNPGPLGLM